MQCEADFLTGTEVDAQIYCPDFEWPLKIKRAIVRWIDKDVFGVEFSTHHELLQSVPELMNECADPIIIATVLIDLKRCIRAAGWAWHRTGAPVCLTVKPAECIERAQLRVKNSMIDYLFGHERSTWCPVDVTNPITQQIFPEVRSIWTELGTYKKLCLIVL